MLKMRRTDDNCYSDDDDSDYDHNADKHNPGDQGQWSPRCTLVANAGGRPFCHKLDIGWVHIGQWIFSILAISDELFWRKSVFCVFTL